MCVFSIDLIIVCVLVFFFFNDTATTEIYTLSLHDALPIWSVYCIPMFDSSVFLDSFTEEEKSILKIHFSNVDGQVFAITTPRRSEEHTSELQSRQYLVCRLLLEKKTYKYEDIAANWLMHRV